MENRYETKKLLVSQFNMHKSSSKERHSRQQKKNLKDEMSNRILTNAITTTTTCHDGKKDQKQQTRGKRSRS